ncbi:EscT/YscT/HrcT family type III secretion system export apparatus protein [Limnobacter sp.]|uniref:EscT/YscT/HrcT family type III secretion system export apparatus protein n=1 Tax=Limnobacter sp. TaxID=2003368 RepID=UPI003518937F
MIDELQSADDALRQYIAVLMYFLPRSFAFMWFFPVFNKGATSTLIKSAVATSLVLYPAFSVGFQMDAEIVAPSLTVTTFLSEVMLGAMLGMTIFMPYAAFKAFGAFIEVFRGATFAAQATGNDSGEELPLETLFGYLFVALIFAGPGLHAIAVHLLNSYMLMPPGTIVTASLTDWGLTLLRMVADHVSFGMLLAGPILVAVLVVELCVEIVSAFAQQLQVYSLQFGLRSVFGIAALLVMLHYTEDEIFRLFAQYSDNLSTLLGVAP